MLVRKIWVMQLPEPVLLVTWDGLNKYSIGTFIYDPTDTGAPWGRVAKGVSGHVWHTCPVEKILELVPANIRLMAMLLN